MFIESKASTREVARHRDVHQSTVVRWVDEMGRRRLNAAETNQVLEPRWSGLVGVDGKIIRVAGRKRSCLLAADLRSLDIVQYELAPAEDEPSCRQFLLNLRQQIWPLRGIVSDLGKGRVWLKLGAEIFPDVAHQACIVPFDRSVDQTLPQSPKSQQDEKNQRLRQLIKQVLFASTFNDAEEIFSRLMDAKSLFPAPCQRTVLKSLSKHFDLLTAHFHTPDLDSTKNVTEKIIKQLDRKIFLLSDFETFDTALNFIRLWVISYRFHPLRSSEYDFRNGRSPLQLARVETGGIDWLNFALKSNN